MRPRVVLIEERKRRGLTQEQVAKALGISRTAYVRYETGSRTPDLATALRIAQMLQRDVDFLFGQDVPQRNNTDRPTSATA